MNKMSIEFKKWYQEYSPSHENTAGHVFLRNLLCRGTAIRSGQFFGAALLAYGLYFLNLWSGDGVRLLVALAATSALVYIGLATQSRTGTLALLNLAAVPILVATAYAGMNVAADWLILSFILHGSLTAVQLSSVDKDLRGGLFCWSGFNGAMALLLLLG